MIGKCNKKSLLCVTLTNFIMKNWYKAFCFELHWLNLNSIPYFLALYIKYGCIESHIFLSIFIRNSIFHLNDINKIVCYKLYWLFFHLFIDSNNCVFPLYFLIFIEYNYIANLLSSHKCNPWKGLVQHIQINHLRSTFCSYAGNLKSMPFCKNPFIKTNSFKKLLWIK